MFSIFEQVMLDLLLREVIRDTLDSHIARFFVAGAAANRPSQRFLTSSAFMVPIVTFIKRKIDITMEQKYRIAFTTDGSTDNVEINKDVDDLTPNCFDSRTDRPL